MSKRFGRNQKRRMLERIEEAEFAQLQAQGWMQLNREKIERAEAISHQLTSWASDIGRLCGNNSAFLRIWDKMSYRGERAFRFPETPRMPVSFDTPMDEMTAWRTIECFIYTLEAYPDEIRQTVLIELESSNHRDRWAYAIDDQTFYAMPPRFVEKMSLRIAELLARHVRQIGMGEGGMTRDSDAAAIAAPCGDMAVPKDQQARAGTASPIPSSPQTR